MSIERKIKIFVHEISHASEGAHDRDREYYTPIHTAIHIYSNRAEFDFSDFRYWQVVEELKKTIESQQGSYNHYGYTGDFDENHCRERTNEFLARIICEKLGGIMSDEQFEVYKLSPYKETQCRAWDKNLYYDPQNSECCYEITDFFLQFPGIDGYYENFLRSNEVYYGYTLIQEHLLERKLNEWNAKIIELKKELDKLQKECNDFNYRRTAFCSFILKHLDVDPPIVNDMIEISPVPQFMIRPQFYGTKGCFFYPLNVALELGKKDIVHKLIDQGAYKLAEGYFEDIRNNVRGRFNHNLDVLLKYYCDDTHYNLLKKNLKDNFEWNDELEAKFPDK